MQLLFLIAPLRSGSHMVRSMLREEPTIIDERREHDPVVDAELPRLYGRPETSLVNLKYGHLGFLRACLAAEDYPDAAALILYRRDWKAQAASLSFALRNRTWDGPVAHAEKVTIDWEAAARQAERNAAELEQLRGLGIPQQVLAYEDLTVDTVRDAVSQLLGRAVLVVEPATVKVAPPTLGEMVTNPPTPQGAAPGASNRS